MDIFTLLFLAVLFAASCQDAKKMEIEDGCPAAIALLAAADMSAAAGPGIYSRLAGALCVSIPFLITALIIPGAFGGGDIKLAAAGGLFLGRRLMAAAGAASILLAGVYALYLLAGKKAGRKKKFPFGPFLCMGMAVSLFCGETLICWYMG